MAWLIPPLLSRPKLQSTLFWQENFCGLEPEVVNILGTEIKLCLSTLGKDQDMILILLNNIFKFFESLSSQEVFKNQKRMLNMGQWKACRVSSLLPSRKTITRPDEPGWDVQPLWLQWVSSPPSAGCPLWLPGAHTSYFEDGSGSRDKQELLASPLEPHLLVSPFSPGRPLHLPFISQIENCWMSICFLLGKYEAMGHLLFICLGATSVFHGLHQGSWKHVMSNINIFYCYATFQCFGLEIASWILFVETHIRTCTISPLKYFWLKYPCNQMVSFCLFFAKGSILEVREDSMFSYKSLI